eukprot:2721300-Amphidinium_carterae.1
MEWEKSVTLFLRHDSNRVAFGLRFPPKFLSVALAALGRDPRHRFVLSGTSQEWIEHDVNEVLGATGWCAKAERSIMSGRSWLIRSAYPLIPLISRPI